MGTKKKINGSHSSAATSFRYSPDYNHSSVLHTGSNARTRSPDYHYYRSQRNDRQHLGGVESNVRLYNSCQTLMVSSPPPPPSQHYIITKNQKNLRQGQYLSNKNTLDPYNGNPALGGFSTSSSFISASSIAASQLSSKHRQHHAVYKQSFQQKSSNRSYICDTTNDPKHQSFRNHHFHNQVDISSNEDDYSGSGEEDCNTLCYDISADDIHEAPRLNRVSDYLVSREAIDSNKVPSYSLWRRQIISKHERTDDYPTPFGSSASYYTSDAAKALIFDQDGDQSSYRLNKSEKTTIKRKTVSTTVSNSIGARTSLTRKSSHRKSTKRRPRVVTTGTAIKNFVDSSIPIKSSLKKQSSYGIENGHIVTQKVSMAQVTRQVSIRRRKSMKRNKLVSNKKLNVSTGNKIQQYYSNKELDCIEGRDRFSQTTASTNKSKSSSTLKSCRDMSEFETLPPPSKYLENSKHNSGTYKSVLTNEHNSRASSKSRRSKPKHLDEGSLNHTEDGLFVNRIMLNQRDKEYEDACLKSKSRKNKKRNSVKIEGDGHGKVCCGGSACCNER